VQGGEVLSDRRDRRKEQRHGLIRDTLIVQAEQSPGQKKAAKNHRTSNILLNSGETHGGVALKEREGGSSHCFCEGRAQTSDRGAKTKAPTERDEREKTGEFTGGRKSQKLPENCFFLCFWGGFFCLTKQSGGNAEREGEETSWGGAKGNKL